MPSSLGEKSIGALKFGIAAYRETIHDKDRKRRLEGLGDLVDQMIEFIYRYADLRDPTLSHTDEIVNWTLPNVADDLTAAIWTTATGCYKAAASLMRSAFDMGFCALYFQVRENQRKRAKKPGWNEHFMAWDGGAADTPGWGTTMPVVSKLATVRQFDETYKASLVREAHNHFKYLSGFIHSRAYHSGDQAEPMNVMTMDLHSPEFSVELFNRMEALLQHTVSWICIPWAVAFPALVRPIPRGPMPDPRPYSNLLRDERGRQALEFAYGYEQSERSASR